MKGFTLIEILFALAVVAFLAGSGAFVFSRMNAAKTLDGETEKTLSLLHEARQLTLSAKDGAAYGVHFEEHKAVLFQGPTYSAAASSNKEYSFVPSVKISAISFAGGGVDAVFKKLTGATEHSGFVRFSLIMDANASSTITIEETGIAYSN